MSRTKILLVGAPNSGKSSIFNSLTGLKQKVANYAGVTVDLGIGEWNDFEVIDLPGLYSLYSGSLEETLSTDILLKESQNGSFALIVLVIDITQAQQHLHLWLECRELHLPIVIVFTMLDLVLKENPFPLLHPNSDLSTNLSSNFLIKKLSKCEKDFGTKLFAVSTHKSWGWDYFKMELQGTIQQIFHQGKMAYSQSLNFDSHVENHNSIVYAKGKYFSFGEEIDIAIEKIVFSHQLEKWIPYPFLTRLYAIGFLYQSPQILRQVQQYQQKLQESKNDSASSPTNLLWVDVWNDIESYIKKLTLHYQNIHKISIKASMAIKKDQVINKLFLPLKPILKTEVSKNLEKKVWQEKVDNLLTHKWFGIPIMLPIIYAIYSAIFWLKSMPTEWIETFFSWLSEKTSILLTGLLQDPESLFTKLITEGIIESTGGILSFVPLIFLTFLFLSALEESGYISRIAFNLDRIFQFFGMQGGSALPFLISGGIAGGCAVPGVMSTRALRNHKERLITMLTAPFMVCGAKLPVYVLIIDLFFPKYPQMILLIITLLSWGVAFFFGYLLNWMIQKGLIMRHECQENMPQFLMELPVYRLPRIKYAIFHAWEKTYFFIKKAVTLLVGISVVIWILLNFHFASWSVIKETPWKLLEKKPVSESMAGKMGKFLEPISLYAGFDWKINLALGAGIPAKEIIITTLATIYATDHPKLTQTDTQVTHNHLNESENETDNQIDPLENASQLLKEKLQEDQSWDMIKAISVMIFILLYSPCLVTLFMIKKESHHSFYALSAFVFYTVSAFLCSTLFYQISRLLHLTSS